ncbi:MAG: serine/threonine protein kinase [Candidatus Wallbacteria bacterium]|nr:serine/threonine protein kinase [Candidatus Wallbacteria bacterium]
MPVVPGYRILQELASGASGTVYRALQEQLGREVALKILAPGLFGAAETRARFLREAKLQARLVHPNLLHVYDAGFAGSRPWLAMELVEGGTLRDLLIRRGRLPQHEALALALGIGHGLAAAHQSRIIHRDLKPENVLLGDEWTPKVADFGLAKQLGAGHTLQTAADRVMGTPGYIAPEALLGAPASEAADIYALGAMLHEMLAGRKAFRGETAQEILQSQVAGSATPLSEELPGCPGRLEELLLDCLSGEPGKRPPAVSVVIERLEALLGELPATPVSGQNASAVDQSGVATAVLSQRRIEAAGGERRPAPTLAQRAAPGRRVPGWAVAAGVAGLAIVVAIAIGRAPGREPGLGAQPVPQAPVQVSLPQAPAKASLPAVQEVTTGSVQAHVWLAAEAPPGMELKYRAHGAKAWRTHVVAPGASDFLLENLRDSTNYEGVLSLGKTTAPVNFRTRIFDELRGTTYVTAMEGTVLGIVADNQGKRLAAVCVRRTGADEIFDACTVESPDGGATWRSPMPLVADVSDDSLPSIAALEDGLVATVPCGPAPDGRTLRVLEKRWGEGAWRVRADPRLFNSHMPTLVKLGETGAGVLSIGETGFRLARLRPGTAVGPFPNASLDQDDTYGFSWRDGRFHAFSKTWRYMLNRKPELLWSSAPLEVSSDSLEGWSPLVSLGTAGQYPGSLAAVATEARIVVAFHSDNQVYWMQTKDGAGFSRPQRLDLPVNNEANLPDLTRRGEDIYLACHQFETTGLPPYQRLVVRRLAAGSDRLEVVARLPLVADDIKEIRILALADRLVLLSSNRHLGTMASVLPVRADVPTGQTHPPFKQPARP